MNWPENPATERQLMLLKDTGCVPDRPLSVTEAARLIRQYQKRSPSALATVDMISPRSRAEPRSPGPSLAPVRPGGLSDSAKLHAYRLHTAVENASRAMTESATAPNARADLVSAVTGRQDFWVDTCREVGEMRLASLQVMEFYQTYGCRFSVPTRAQVQEIFDALDTALPSWERDHPELFYQTLELNFPETVRRR